MSASNSPTLLIFADDLTGAAECAAYCHDACLPAWICLDEARLPASPTAMALSTDSRHLDPESARRRVASAVTTLSPQPSTHLFKKIDSLLRGNPGSEIDALLAATSRPNPAAALICPALPSQCRAVHGGRLVGGPADGLSVLDALNCRTEQAAALIPLSVVRQGVESIVDALRYCQRDRTSLVVVDAETDDDLDAIARASLQTETRTRLCGSAALCGALARVLKTEPLDVSPLPALHEGPWLAVIGSASPEAHAQIRYAVADGALAFEIVPDVAAPPLPEETNLILHLPYECAAARRSTADRAHALQLAELSQGYAYAKDFRRLIVSGGDTAQMVLNRLTIGLLEVVAVPLPGMPLCRGVADDGRTLAILLKAGNHGPPETLARLLAA